LAISSKNIASLLDFTVQGAGKWKKENIQNNKRKIISLLEKYFIDEDIVEFLETGKISKLENTSKYISQIDLLQSLNIDNAIFSAKDKLQNYEKSWMDWNLYKPAVNILKDVLKTIDENEISIENAKDILVKKITGYEASWFSLQAKFPSRKQMISNLIQRYFSTIECYAICKYPEEVFDYIGYWGKEKFDKDSSK